MDSPYGRGFTLLGKWEVAGRAGIWASSHEAREGKKPANGGKKISGVTAD
jgi:hypothetical protein